MKCSICSSTEFTQKEILWPRLIEEWGIAPHEVAYINEQQGLSCNQCHSNLRSITLAEALLQVFRFSGNFLEFTNRFAQRLRILEINPAGDLTRSLTSFRSRTLVEYPTVDIQNMKEFADGSFDVVIHSDTLEHVPNPVQGLSECRRVLTKGGVLAYTIPIIIGRMTRRRDSLPPSFHGCEADSADDLKVVTEYGADFWTQLFEAGFTNISMHTVRSPASFAITAIR